MSNNKEMPDKLNFPKSPWQAEAQFRADNKTWLRRSQAIAIAILRRLRELKITQKELAERMRVSPQQINKWVKGTENFRLETISKLEEALQFEMIGIIGTSIVNKNMIPYPVSEMSENNTMAEIKVPSETSYKCIPLYGEATYSENVERIAEAV